MYVVSTTISPVEINIVKMNPIKNITAYITFIISNGVLYPSSNSGGNDRLNAKFIPNNTPEIRNNTPADNIIDADFKVVLNISPVIANTKITMLIDNEIDDHLPEPVCVLNNTEMSKQKTNMVISFLGICICIGPGLVSIYNR